MEKNEATSGHHETVSVKEVGGVVCKVGKEVVGADGRGGWGGRVDKGNERIVAVEIGEDARMADMSDK